MIALGEGSLDGRRCTRSRPRLRWLVVAATLVSTLAPACASRSEMCTALTCQSAGASCGEVPDGCGGTLDCGPCEPVSQLAAGDRWSVPGLPVVKLLSSAPGEIAALVEQHIVSDAGARIGYVLEHPRRVVVLRHGSATPEEVRGAWGDDDLLTDIAAGPASGSLWIASVRWNPETKEIERRMALFADSSRESVDAPMREVASIALDPARFPEVDGMAANLSGLVSYLPAYGDPIDVLRIASRGALIGLVGRNTAGTAYAERYTYIDGRLRRDASVALTQPSRKIHVGMTGGTYDVLGWLGNRYRVHAALADSGTLYAGVVVGYPELLEVDELLGSSLGATVDLDRMSQLFALILTVDEAGVTAPVEARLISEGIMEALLLDVVVKGERCLYGGLTRELDGRSNPTLFEARAAPQAMSTTHASAALQAIAVDEGGRIWAGGSWGWNQNPAGLSIGGGERFASLLPAAGEVWDEGNVLSPGRRRSEARAILLPRPGVICIGGMDNGPDTHAADGDASLVSGDGFVDCLAR